MKRHLLLSGLCASILCLISCNKYADENDISKMLASKVNPIPNVPQCPSGQHWSYTLLKCVPTCTSPYVNDPNTGQCVLPNTFPYTPAQLVSGIFFFQGTVASNIPYFSSFRSEIAKFSAAQTDSMNNFINLITAKMNSLSPNFQTRFQANIAANNPDSITANMDEGAGLILSAIALTNYNQASITAGNVYDSMNINNYNFNTAGGIDTFLRDYGNRVTGSNNVVIPDKSSCLWFFAVVAVAVWDAAAAVNYGVLVNVGAVAVVWAVVYSKVLVWPKSHFQSAEEGLERETLVSQIQQYISSSGSSSAASRPKPQ